MAVNRKWCKTDGVRIWHAPTWLKNKSGLVVNPGDELYRADGWMEDKVKPPSPPEGQNVSATRYAVKCEGGLYSVEAVYDYADTPKVPRTFSKLRLVLALKRRGLFGEFQTVVRAAQLDDEWNAAQDIAEDFPGFEDYSRQIGGALGLTDAEVEEILGEAVVR